MSDESVPQLPSRRARREAERAAQRGWFGGLSNTGSLPVIPPAEPVVPASDDDTNEAVTAVSEPVEDSVDEQPPVAPVAAATPTFMPRRERRLLMESGVLPTLPKPTVDSPVFDNPVPSFMADAIQDSSAVSADKSDSGTVAEQVEEVSDVTTVFDVAQIENEALEVAGVAVADEEPDSEGATPEVASETTDTETRVTHVIPPVTRPEPIEVSVVDETFEDEQPAAEAESDADSVIVEGAETDLDDDDATDIEADVVDGTEAEDVTEVEVEVEVELDGDSDAEASDDVAKDEDIESSEDDNEPDIALDADIETDPEIEEELDEDDIDRWLGEADQDAINAPVTWSLGLPEPELPVDGEAEEVDAQPDSAPAVNDAEAAVAIDAAAEGADDSDADADVQNVDDGEAHVDDVDQADDEVVADSSRESEYEPAEIPAVHLDTAPIAHVEQDEYEFRVIPQHPIDDHEYELVPVEHDLPEVEVPDPNPEGLSPASIPNIENLTAPIDLPIEGGWREQVDEENDDDIAPSQGIGYSNAGVSANTLTLPEIPTQDLSVPLNATGEILLTGPIMTINQTFDTAPLFVDEAQPTIEATPEVQMAPRRAQEALVLIGRPAEDDDKKTVPTTSSAVYAGVAAFLGLIVITVGALALFTDIL